MTCHNQILFLYFSEKILVWNKAHYHLLICSQLPKTPLLNYVLLAIHFLVLKNWLDANSIIKMLWYCSGNIWWHPDKAFPITKNSSIYFVQIPWILVTMGKTFLFKQILRWKISLGQKLHQSCSLGTPSLLYPRVWYMVDSIKLIEIILLINRINRVNLRDDHYSERVTVGLTAG